MQKIPAVSPPQSAYLAPHDEAVEAQYIASIQNHAQRHHEEAQLTLVICTAKISNLGHQETIYCRHAHLAPTHYAVSSGVLLTRILEKGTSEIGPMCLSQQYETQQESSNKIIYVHGSWLSSFHFAILVTHPRCDQEFCILEVRLRPAALLMQVRAESLAYTFPSWPEVSVPIEEKRLLKNLAE